MASRSVNFKVEVLYGTVNELQVDLNIAANLQQLLRSLLNAILNYYYYIYSVYEVDLTPNEDDDDAELHRKLVRAKLARKRAEEDLKLLCNRIGLLKHEEGKVS